MQLNTNELSNIFMQSSEYPLLAAFLLGILVAVNPCQLAISISALAYEYRNGKQLTDALVYAAGRAITYTLLAWVTMCLIGGGLNVSGLQHTLSKAEDALPYVLIATGAYMIYRAFKPHHHGDSCHNSKRIIKRNGPLGALVLGMTLALAFCPESAIFYFGLMIPLGIADHMGFLVPPVFALGASLPIIAIAWTMKKTINGAERMSRNFERFQQIQNIVVGLLFIFIAILLLL